MKKTATIILGLALLIGAIAFAGYRFSGANNASSSQAARNLSPSAKRTQTMSGVQIFDMGLNIANVLVGVLGIWMTMRGMRAERRSMAMRQDR
ncbi:MAG: hypothetical protein R3D67_09095 [Hyphomicrobiaceae bacterium]